MPPRDHPLIPPCFLLLFFALPWRCCCCYCYYSYWSSSDDPSMLLLQLLLLRLELRRRREKEGSGAGEEVKHEDEEEEGEGTQDHGSDDDPVVCMWDGALSQGWNDRRRGGVLGQFNAARPPAPPRAARHCLLVLCLCPSLPPFFLLLLPPTHKQTQRSCCSPDLFCCHVGFCASRHRLAPSS